MFETAPCERDPVRYMCKRAILALTFVWLGLSASQNVLAAPTSDVGWTAVAILSLQEATGEAVATESVNVEAATAAHVDQPSDAAAASTDAESASEAENSGPGSAEIAFSLDNLILFLAAVLVLAMQPGFALVECGFNQAKNAANICFKNLIDLSLGALLYFLIGYSLMYGADLGYGLVGWSGFGISETLSAETVPAAGVLHPQADWLFQVAFAATAATIVSGAVAGRIKFPAYLIYTAFITAIVYPVSGHWKWGKGWLDALGFHDFAGSLVVHAVGGFAGLAGAFVLGPRLGRYTPEGKSQPILGHNLPLATLGVFILWIGWYGFNPGSQLAFTGAANLGATMLIAVNTTLAAAAGAVAAMSFAWLLFGKPDLSMALNGVLGGLVGITANCDCVSNPEAILIGLVAGLLVVIGVVVLDRIRIDDPVGAWPVHGLCGIWGGIATGLFGTDKSLVAQIVGSTVIPLWAFILALGLFLALRAADLLRVSPEEEIEGLDICEHGMHAYGLPERV